MLRKIRKTIQGMLKKKESGNSQHQKTPEKESYYIQNELVEN
jgi:hypothetical protein